MANRLSLDDYFMEIAHTVGKRSTCVRHSNGAVIVRDKRILSTGYNGTHRGGVHCTDVGCLKDELAIPSGKGMDICRATGCHAEQNAIVAAAYFGIPTKGAIIYSTHFPCRNCARQIVNAGIVEMIYDENYPIDSDLDETTLQIFEEGGVEIRHYKQDAKH